MLGAPAHWPPSQNTEARDLPTPRKSHDLHQSVWPNWFPAGREPGNVSTKTRCRADVTWSPAACTCLLALGSSSPGSSTPGSVCSPSGYLRAQWNPSGLCLSFYR